MTTVHNYKALLAAAETAGREVCDERDQARDALRDAHAALDVEIGRGDKATGRVFTLAERINFALAGLHEETKRGDDAEDKVDRQAREIDRLKADLLLLGALKSEEVAPVIERFRVPRRRTRRRLRGHGHRRGWRHRELARGSGGFRAERGPMSAKGYVVRGTAPGDVLHEEARDTLHAAVSTWTALVMNEAARPRIFAVAEDGTETPLPSYEEALAEIVRVSRSEAACVREALEQVGVARVERDEARAESARVPGLEQANREAHQAIAALKAKAARVNEAWARFYVASENVFVMAIGSVGEGRDLAPERAKREAAREALRALVADVDVLLKEADR